LSKSWQKVGKKVVKKLAKSCQKFHLTWEKPKKVNRAENKKKKKKIIGIP
jgi:hypothetical protein